MIDRVATRFLISWSYGMLACGYDGGENEDYRQYRQPAITLIACLYERAKVRYDTLSNNDVQPYRHVSSAPERHVAS
jgi:hypothetical protein